MMHTKIVKVDENKIDTSVIKCAGQALREGKLVAFPTETVYGLGGDALNKKSSEKIYSAKGRPSDNPLIVHICKWEDILKIAEDIPETAKRLAEVFWPGPLTMILKKTEVVPKETTGGLNTVAVRMPANKTALALIEASGGYIAAPSANASGRPSPTLAEHVVQDLDGKIEMILDGGPVGIGLESTIVDLTETNPIILRPGFITKEMLEKALNSKVLLDRPLACQDAGQPPKAPGMKYRHYAPKGKLTIVSGKSDAVKNKIQSLVREKERAGEKTGVICTDETKSYYLDLADWIESVGSREDEEEIAHRLFAILRKFDEEHVTAIYSESFSDRGIGMAIMNRLLKAAGHHVIEI